jgi:hypothetical protein
MDFTPQYRRMTPEDVLASIREAHRQQETL